MVRFAEATWFTPANELSWVASLLSSCSWSLVAHLPIENEATMILLGFQAALLAILFWPIGVASVDSSGPSVTVKNGSYVGKNVPEWKQDHFLGMPYAKAPIGSLRFARPLSLTDSFTGTRDATEYGASCYQYGTNFTLSEDCLTLNGKL